jgi:hypothetical protein
MIAVSDGVMFPPGSGRKPAVRRGLIAASLLGVAGTVGGWLGSMLPAQLEQAAQYIEARMTGLGYQPRRQSYEAGGRVFSNLEVEAPGSRAPGQLVVIGAHYVRVSTTYQSTRLTGLRHKRP